MQLRESGSLLLSKSKIPRAPGELEAEKKRRKEQDDFTFNYEEEADPEVFFVPYVWEVIVCVVTSSTIEWKKDDIRAFALLDPIEEPIMSTEQDTEPLPGTAFEPNAEELV